MNCYNNTPHLIFTDCQGNKTLPNMTVYNFNNNDPIITNIKETEYHEKMFSINTSSKKQLEEMEVYFNNEWNYYLGMKKDILDSKTLLGSTNHLSQGKLYEFTVEQMFFIGNVISMIKDKLKSLEELKINSFKYKVKNIKRK